MPRMREQEHYGPPMGMPPFPPPPGFPVPNGFMPPPPPPGMPPPPMGMPPMFPPGMSPPPHLLPQFFGVFGGMPPPPGDMPPPPEGFPQFPTWDNTPPVAAHPSHPPATRDVASDEPSQPDDRLGNKPTPRTLGISPCQKQIERFRRLLDYAKDNTSKSDKPVLSDEQQNDLLVIQRKHHTSRRLSDGASRRPQKPSATTSRSHENTTSTQIARRATSRTRGSRNQPSSGLHEPIKRSIHSNYVKTKYAALKQQEEEQLDCGPNITTDDVMEQYSSPLRVVNHKPGIARISIDALVDRAPRYNSVDTADFERHVTTGVPSEPPDEVMAQEDEEQERLQDLDALHSKLRHTYLSIQRNPQQFLDGISGSANVPAQSYPGPSHELLNNLLTKERAATSADDGSRAVSFFKSAPSAKQLRLTNDLKQIETQWDRLASVQDSRSKCDFSTPHLSASFATSNTAMGDDKKRISMETENRLQQRVKQLKDRTGA